MGWTRRHRHCGRYHHGNLKEALLTAARDLIAELGPAGFSLAEAARRAGVSPAAPYRHFAHRDALLAEVAQRGFLELERRLSAAWDGGRPEAGAALQRMGEAYLAFAAEEPAAYAAMFEAELPTDQRNRYREAAERSFKLLVDGAAAVMHEAASRPDLAPDLVALHIWSMTHGIASLFHRRGGPQGPAMPSAAALLASGVATYLAGLGLGAPKQATRPSRP